MRNASRHRQLIKNVRFWWRESARIPPAALTITLALATLGCAESRSDVCGPPSAHIDAARAIQLGSSFALREPALLRRLGYSADELAAVLRDPDCCQAFKVSPEYAANPEWWITIHTQEANRPWEIVVILDLCGGYREMNWVRLGPGASAP